MRIATIPEIKQNLVSYQPFLRRVAVGTLIFGICMSLLLAECMHQSIFFALGMWTIVAPLIWVVGNGLSWFAQHVVDQAPVLSVDIPPSIIHLTGWFAADSAIPVPTSPPRLRLASCEA